MPTTAKRIKVSLIHLFNSVKTNPYIGPINNKITFETENSRGFEIS